MGEIPGSNPGGAIMFAGSIEERRSEMKARLVECSIRDQHIGYRGQGQSETGLFCRNF